MNYIDVLLESPSWLIARDEKLLDEIKKGSVADVYNISPKDLSSRASILESIKAGLPVIDDRLKWNTIQELENILDKDVIGNRLVVCLRLPAEHSINIPNLMYVVSSLANFCTAMSRDRQYAKLFIVE